jgi:hypothetical protein
MSSTKVEAQVYLKTIGTHRVKGQHGYTYLPITGYNIATNKIITVFLRICQAVYERFQVLNGLRHFIIAVVGRNEFNGVNFMISRTPIVILNLHNAKNFQHV